MSKNIIQIILVVLAITLSACTRAASSAPVVTATPGANFPKPVATSGMNAIEIAGTQTSVATSGMPMPIAEGTEVGVPTFTPLADAQTPLETVAAAQPEANTPMPSPTSEMIATAEVNTPLPQPTAGPIVRPATYVLNEGEFPYCLARRFNIDPAAILSLNNLSSGQSYYAPGTTITIPQSGNAFPGQRALIAHPAQYTVRASDTIYSIACRFGDVDPMGIVSANNLTGTYSLTVGSTIQIP